MSHRHATLVLSLISFFLTTACAGSSFLRDDYQGRDTTLEKAVKRDAYGNAILDERDKPQP